MNTAEARVEEFREVVEKVIDRSVQARQHGGIQVSWSGMHNYAEDGGLAFSSVDKGEGRPSMLGLAGEHLWGVSSQRLRYGKRLGYLSVISYASDCDSLVRRWAFDSGLQMISVDTTKTLSEPEELDDALTWVKSPHLASDELNRLASLMPKEVKRIDPMLVEHATSARKLYEDLGRIADRRQRGLMAEDILEESGWASD